MNSYEVYNTQWANREEIVWRNQQDVMKAVAKAQELGKVKFEQEQRKMQLSEMRRQAHKAEYMDLELTQSGELMIKVQNPLIDVPNRKIVNFRLNDAVELRSVDGERGIICVFVEMDGQEKKFLLSEEKIGQSGYFLKKIVQHGGQIYIERKSRKEALLELLWQKILLLAAKKENNYIEISKNHGWNVNQHGELRFAKEGEKLWADIQKAAK